MAVFKGEIEKRVMTRVRGFIKEVEKEYDDFVSQAEVILEESVKKLKEDNETGKTKKADEIVERVFSKFVS